MTVVAVVLCCRIYIVLIWASTVICSRRTILPVFVISFEFTNTHKMNLADAYIVSAVRTPIGIIQDIQK